MNTNNPEEPLAETGSRELAPGQIWKDSTGMILILLDSFDFGSRWKAATTFGAPESGYVQPICRMTSDESIRKMKFIGTIEGPVRLA